MIFSKYNSIENSYRQKTVNIIKEYYPGIEYIVQEKIHGANFSIWCDDNEIKYAKRGGWIDNNFYSYKSAVRDIDIDIVYVRRILNCKEFVLWGELCGGDYPGLKSDDTKVQKGIYYHPDNIFVCFDISIDGQLIEVDRAEEICNDFDILFTPTLFRGTLDECLEFNIERNSDIPDMFGLPKIEENLIEGVVIKPNSPCFLPNNSRVVLKKKNEKFSEKVSKPKEKASLSQDVLNLLAEVSDYITENRLNNVLSKVGQVTQKDFGKVNGLFAKDVIEDFEKDMQDNWFDRDVDGVVLHKQINSLCATFLRSRWLSILDRNCE